MQTLTACASAGYHADRFLKLLRHTDSLIPELTAAGHPFTALHAL